MSPGRLTVFVGPNNAGKTRALKDIVAALCGSHERLVAMRAVDCARPDGVRELMNSAQDYSFIAERVGVAPGVPEAFGSGWTGLGVDLSAADTRQTRLRWPEGFELLFRDAVESDEMLEKAGWQGQQFRDWFGHLYGPRLVGFLRTDLRLQMLSRGSVQPQASPQSLLEALMLAPDHIEKEIHRAFQDSFGTDFVLDYSQLHTLRIMIGPGAENLPAHPRELAAALAGWVPLEEQGDGMRAFLGILVALGVVNRPILLVDEPEAFLHPPQARRIGEMLGGSARSGRQIIVATHSVDVLRGLLASTDAAQIVRLTRDNMGGRAKVLDPRHLTELADDPVLGSSRVLDAIFYSRAVIVEGDRDARFYQAVSDRLKVREAPHFVSAGGKQTVGKLLSEYRRLRIPAAAILDVDILRDGKEFRRPAQGSRRVCGGHWQAASPPSGSCGWNQSARRSGASRRRVAPKTRGDLHKR